MERRLTAILAADVVGYSRLMGEDEAGTLTRLKSLRRESVQPRITAHKGRIVKLLGDGLLAEFPSVIEAVQCAVDIQQETAKREAGTSDHQRIWLRIGINLGDVIVEGSDIYGDGVNVAARLEALADPGGICVSGTVFDSVKGKVSLDFLELGEQHVKNIGQPVRVYRIALEGWTEAREAAGATNVSAEVLELPDKPSIAVLPFDNMSGGPEQEYFSDGITEDIITELSRFNELFVIARNSSFAYKGKAVNVRVIGRELGVQYLVEGSVRKAGSRVRVNAQLVEAESGNHLWAERYDRELEDIFAVQDELAQAIVSVLPVRLQCAALERASRKPTKNLSAYEKLLRARWQWQGDVGNFQPVIDTLEEAVAMDPGCARAYAMMAFIYSESVFTVTDRLEEFARRAHTHAEKALAADDGDAFVHAVAAIAYVLCGDHDLARRHSDKAIELNPNEIQAALARGATATHSGELDEGLEWLQRTRRLDPRMPQHYLEWLIECHYMRREYAEAIEAFKLWRDPPHYILAMPAACHAQLGHSDETRAVRDLFLRTRPETYNVAVAVEAHCRSLKRQEDRDHWLEGYRKAGLVS